MLCRTCYAWPCLTEPNLKWSGVFFLFCCAVSKKHGKLITFLRTFMKSRPTKQKLKQRGILKERVFGCDLGEHLLNSGHDGKKLSILAFFLCWESYFRVTISSKGLVGTSGEMCHKNWWLKGKLRLTLVRSKHRGSTWAHWRWMELLKMSCQPLEVFK